MPTADKNNDLLLESVAKIANHLESVAPKTKKVSHFEYMMARKKRHKLSRDVYMSGIRIRERQLTDDQIELLNRVVPGTYNGGRWTVIGRQAEGLDNGIIEIYVRNKTQEDRGLLALEAPSLDVMLQKMIAEAASRDKK